MDSFNQLLELVFGISKEFPDMGHMIARSFLVYIMGLLVIWLDRRFIGERTSLDTMLQFILGSALANCIVSNSPFFPTICAVLFIVFLNWILALICFYNKHAEKILKGQANIIYKNHTFDYQIMRRHNITKNDIMSELRKKGIEHLNKVDKIFFENSGEISVILISDNQKQFFESQNGEI